MPTTPDQHPPGSPEAVAQGCSCSTTLNRHGQGTLHGQPRFYYDRKCPVHRHAEVGDEVATIAKEAPKRPRRRPMPPLTLGQAVAARVRLIVWCRACQHRFEPDTAALAEEHGAATTVLAWAKRLRCTECGARDADFVVSGAGR